MNHRSLDKTRFPNRRRRQHTSQTYERIYSTLKTNQTPNTEKQSDIHSRNLNKQIIEIFNWDWNIIEQINCLLNQERQSIDLYNISIILQLLSKKIELFKTNHEFKNLINQITSIILFIDKQIDIRTFSLLIFTLQKIDSPLNIWEIETLFSNINLSYLPDSQDVADTFYWLKSYNQLPNWLTNYIVKLLNELEFKDWEEIAKIISWLENNTYLSEITFQTIKTILENDFINWSENFLIEILISLTKISQKNPKYDNLIERFYSKIKKQNISKKIKEYDEYINTKSFFRKIRSLLDNEELSSTIDWKISNITQEHPEIIDIYNISKLIAILCNRVIKLKNEWKLTIQNFKQYKHIIKKYINILNKFDWHLPNTHIATILWLLWTFDENTFKIQNFDPLFKKLDLNSRINEKNLLNIIIWLKWYKNIPDEIINYIFKNVLLLKTNNGLFLSHLIAFLKDCKQIPNEIIKQIKNNLNNLTLMNVFDIRISLFGMLPLIRAWYDLRPSAQILFEKLRQCKKIYKKDIHSSIVLYSIYKFYVFPDLKIPSKIQQEHLKLLTKRTASDTENKFAKIIERFNKNWFTIKRNLVIDGYEMDFYIEELKINIELDWFLHLFKKDKDGFRDSFLFEKHWIKTIRLNFNNYWQNEKTLIDIFKKAPINKLF